MLTQIGLFLMFLVLSAFFSSSETAFLSVNPYTLENLERKGSGRARLIRKMLARLSELLSTILIGNTLVNAAAASIATSIFVRLSSDPSQAVVLATLTTTVLILVFGEITPKTIAAYRPLRVTSLFIHPIRLLYYIFYPFTWFFSLLTGLFVPREERRRFPSTRHLSEEEIKLVISSGARGLSRFRRKMLAGVLDLNRRPIKEIMVPRTQVRALEINSALPEILKIIQESGYSRYPVFRGSFDNIEGIVHAKDILPVMQSQTEFNLGRLLRRPLFVPELASIEQVLLQMQEKAVHLALVVDEFGSFEGIVTLEDIMEEIVGDIRDEYDRQAEDWYQKVGENEYLIKGTVPIKEINEVLNLGIPEEKDYTTLAGLFLYHYGHLPLEKDSVTIDSLQFTVEKMSRRHLSLIRVRLLTGKDEGQE
ncbi:MAG: Magnesium and cobalt efflux protein CorC [Candidatus Saccharicenans subterraneus]|uniref:Magnesium and cobalt efflux protein CorC n=1 Tax=Candidatus Saccharicenans subterraneus TaxID=2508984 RepID=A0A3E2BQA7_9BACT|nr:MAG: Magnesium and cobalt efflux protein CorC [Candidatus Saccharicenans subterraneum]